MKRSSQLRHRSLALAFAGLIAVPGAVQLLPHTAFAQIGGGWCFDDPVFTVNGLRTQIIVGIQGDASTVGAADVVANVVVYVPAGVSTGIVVPPASSPFVETLSFAPSGETYSGSGPIHLRVKTTFTSTSKFNATLQVTWSSGSSQTVDGTTNGVLNAVQTDVYR